MATNRYLLASNALAGMGITIGVFAIVTNAVTGQWLYFGLGVFGVIGGAAVLLLNERHRRGR